MSYNNSDTFCILPWIHITASPSGFYKPCCNAQQYYDKQLTTDTHSLEHAFNSEPVEQLRKQLSNGVQPEICNACWIKEKKGIKSYRQAYNEKAAFQELLDTSNPTLSYIDIKFDNTCNLQCSYCDISSSNQFERAREFFDTHGIEYPHNMDAPKNFNAEQKAIYVKHILPNLRILKVTGGEPLLSKQFINIVDYAVEQGYADNIVLYLTTNATKFNQDILHKLACFKQVYFTISTESIGKTYNYIRYPFNFDKFDQRVNTLLEFANVRDYINTRKFVVKFAALVTSYNVLDIVPVLEWARELGVKHVPEKTNYFLESFDFNVFIHPLNHPLNIFTLPQHILDTAKQRVQSYTHLKDCNVDIVRAFNNLHTDDSLTSNVSLKRFTTSYDLQRNTDYRILDPIIVDHINRS